MYHKNQICLQPASQQDMFRQSYNRQSKHQHQEHNQPSQQPKKYERPAHNRSCNSLWSSLDIGVLVVAGCVKLKRPEKKQEEMDADENPVYRVYQLSEPYERQYSTNDAVDNNAYYEQ